MIAIYDALIEVAYWVITRTERVAFWLGDSRNAIAIRRTSANGRCPNCDDCGVVHDMEGNILGPCSCPSGSRGES